MTTLPHVILLEPEIPANTGNIIRLCANCGAELHLIEPLGFDLDDKRLRRAGLDYHEFTSVQTWPTLFSYRTAHVHRRIVCVETSATTYHSDFIFQPDDALLFGAETRGLPAQIMQGEQAVRLPMLLGSRSLNLSNSVAVVVYEAWRQLGYSGGT